MRPAQLLLISVLVGSGQTISCSGPVPEDETAATEKTATANLVLKNGKIVTVDAAFSIRQAVAVKGDRIVFAGTDVDVARFIGPDTKIIDLAGKPVLPGFIDAHAHVHGLGIKLTDLDITGAASFEELVELVGQRAKTAEPGQWITGGRWDQNQWPDKTFPAHHALSAVTPANPVYLTRVDGNSAFVNRAALEIAGIDKNTPDPDGGKIIRDKSKEPTGVLINQAMNLVKRHLPEISAQRYKDSVVKALDHCVTLGITSVHEAGVTPWEIGNYKSLIDEDRIQVRIYAMLGEQERPTFDTEDLVGFFKKQRLVGYGNHRLTVRSIKLFFDGALGSRGAAFFEPYADDPGNTGLLRIPPEYITEVARAALQADMGVNTHSIGIRGNRACLDAYEAALKDFPGKDHRLRIEHAQIVRREDIDKFAALGVIPSMQPTHCTSDMGFVTDRVGEKRAKGAYAWRSFLNAGAILPFGSDFPVESPNPLFGIYAATTRQDQKGLPEGGWFPEQRLTVEEAVRGFTVWAAYAAFQEDILGSVEPGKLADLVVLDRDLLKIAPKEILATRVVYTIIGGKIVYSASR